MICQFSDAYLAALKCAPLGPGKEFSGFEAEAVPSGADEKLISGKLSSLIKKLNCENCSVIVSLPRSQVISRNIKIPAQSPEEIEKIIALQASRYLPYPAAELITGYQVIATEAQGYSSINMVIVHKDVIARYVKVLKELNIGSGFKIFLSSYGLCNLYHYLNAAESGPVAVTEINHNHAEVVIVSGNKLLFSRSFKLIRSLPGWEDILTVEISKTCDAYLKEVSMPAVKKLVVLDTGAEAAEFVEFFRKHSALEAQLVPFAEKTGIPQNTLKALPGPAFSSLIGLGLKETDESLNLLPGEIKEKSRKASIHRQRLWIILFLSGIFLLWYLAAIKNLDNKTIYLERLKAEMDKVSEKARPLEEIEKRVRVFEGRRLKKINALDVLHEVYRIMPIEVSLISFNYEGEHEISLRGQGQELNSVFKFVSLIEQSQLFKNFSIKVKYATKKKTQAGEVVDFEITCLSGKSK